MTIQDAKHRPEHADEERNEGEDCRHLVIHLYLEVNLMYKLNSIPERHGIISTMVFWSVLSEPIVVARHVDLVVVMLMVANPRHRLRQ